MEKADLMPYVFRALDPLIGMQIAPKQVALIFNIPIGEIEEAWYAETGRRESVARQALAEGKSQEEAAALAKLPVELISMLVRRLRIEEQKAEEARQAQLLKEFEEKRVAAAEALNEISKKAMKAMQERKADGSV